jgi:hypothetical protein
MMSRAEIPILMSIPEPCAEAARHGEPITVGLPFPKGLTRQVEEDWSLVEPSGQSVAHQTRILERWGDGSVRWALLDFSGDTVRGRDVLYRFVHRLGSRSEPPAQIRVQERDRGVTIDTQAARFDVQVGSRFPFTRVAVGSMAGLDVERSGLHVTDIDGHACRVEVVDVKMGERGPLRSVVFVRGTIHVPSGGRRLDLDARLHFFAGHSTVRFVVTIRNPHRAEHRDNLWDLGDRGSIRLGDCSVVFALPQGPDAAHLEAALALDAAIEPFAAPFELYQDSSGGEAWQSHNHLNARHEVPHTFRGFRARSSGSTVDGLRAAPVARLQSSAGQLAVTMRNFWQNFPKALEADDLRLVLGLFPRQRRDGHEIQGGEQKTHTFAVAFGPDPVCEIPLGWCRTPAFVRSSPEWYCETGSVPFLIPLADAPDKGYEQLVRAGIEGPDTFERKREVIDEYGWRHFGEIYADHEAVRSREPAPLASHYNNQYDPVAGFACQFMRTGDRRWWTLMDELASHVVDIDVYHTDEDKAAYNHGLFWHTYHYVDADTSTHRSYPRASRQEVRGGGPASEHNYPSGLLLHYLLTGDELSRTTALEMAQFVIDIDDGTRTIFRFLARGNTGHASASAAPDYHGAGRGSGNSVNALVDGYRLTNDRRFLDKAHQLIRRCVHPGDDIDALNLLDAERRWFYTMFLQALGKYLEFRAERGERDAMYAYARASLLHYARWMAAHERPYLDHAERLQYPTETWPAQDLRKSEVFNLAALHAEGRERAQFRERATFFFHYAVQTLSGMKTRTLARPMVVLLLNGGLHQWLGRHDNAVLPPPDEPSASLAEKQEFAPQRHVARARLMCLAVAAAAVVLLLLLWAVAMRTNARL